MSSSPISDLPGADWEIATVSVEFEIARSDQAVELAEAIFAFPEVLTVRVGGPGERSVYRVDVHRGRTDVRQLAAAPALAAATSGDADVRVVRIAVTSDGLGDPEGEPPESMALPWRQPSL